MNEHTPLTVDPRPHARRGITRGVNERLPFEAVFEDAEEGVEAVRRDARAANVNTEGRATICASLHEARNGVRIDD